MKVIKTKKGRQITLGHNIYTFGNDCAHFSDKSLLCVAHNHFIDELPIQLDWNAIRDEARELKRQELGIFIK